MILPSQVTLKHQTVRPFRFEQFKDQRQAKMWQAACQFDVRVEVDAGIPPMARNLVEYRQYIAGGVWIRRGSQPWSGPANGNKYFAIPADQGQTAAVGLTSPTAARPGLDLWWKEDGQVEGARVERYGYRDTATLDLLNEKDIWEQPDNTAGRVYRLRDTPAIAGEWGYGDPVYVWVELYFLGVVVQVERDGDTSTPVQILKKHSWEYLWMDKKLSSLDPKDTPVVIPLM